MRRVTSLQSAFLLLVGLGLGMHALGNASATVLARGTHAMLGSASVSLNAHVPPNEYNTLAAALAQKEAELAIREAQLSDTGTTQSTDFSRSDQLAITSFLFSVFLFLLVALNYYLDMRRGRAKSEHIAVSQAL